MIHLGILEMNARITAPFFVFLTICVSRVSGRLINTFKIIRETRTLLQMSQKRTRQMNQCEILLKTQLVTFSMLLGLILNHTA